MIFVAGVLGLLAIAIGASLVWRLSKADEQDTRTLLMDMKNASTLPEHAPRRRTRGEPDLEERIQTEIGRRLDSLQQHRAIFLAQDANNDGVVDDDEWARVRSDIEAEVRAEMGEADGALGTPTGEATAEGPKATEPPGTDGSW